MPDTVPITMRGGELRLVTNRESLSYTETVGPVAILSGSSNIVLHGQFGDSPAELIVSNLDRQPGAVLRFQHTSNHGTLGGGQAMDSAVIVQDSPTLVHGILGGWAVVHDGDHLGRYDFASYGANGIRALSTTGRPNQINGAGRSDHVRLTNTPAPLANDTTIATLVIDNGGFGTIDVDLGGRTLDIASGGLLASRTSPRILNGTLTSSGSGPTSELVVHVEGDAVEIHANLVDSPNSAVSLVKSGTNSLSLFGQNTYSGETVVSEGALVIRNTTALRAGNNVTVAGGSFINDADQPVKIGHLRIDAGYAHRVNADTIVIASGGVSELHGNGTLTKIGADRASLDDARQFHGSIEILDGMLDIRANQTGTGAMIVRRDGNLRIEGDFGTITRAIALDGGELSNMAGTFWVPIRLEQPLDVQADSTVDVGEFNVLSLDAGLNLVAGSTLTKRGLGTLEINGQAVFNQDSFLDVAHGAVRLNAQLVAEPATSTLRFGTSRPELFADEIALSITGDNRSFSGNLVISSMAVDIEHPFALGTGITTVEQGAQLVLRVPDVAGNIVLDGGELITTDSHQFVGNLTNAGDIRPGASPGTLGVQGNFTQQSRGRLVMEIASPLLTGIVYPQATDVLDVTDALTLGGTLAVQLLHDFTPDVGDRFELFRFGELIGEFETIELPALPDDRAWSLTSLYRDGSLSIVSHVMGDSNRDAIFNSADLILVFQAGLYETGQPAGWSEGDWNVDGVFNSTDLVDAMAAGTYVAASVAHVPEPSGVLLAIVGGFFAVLFRHSLAR